MKYGKRALKIEDETGTWYLPFDGERYKELLISTKVEVGASTLWSETQSIRTLDNLFDRKVIDVVQYLSRLPKGTIPNVNGLIRELQAANASAQGAPPEASSLPQNVQSPDQMTAALSPENQTGLDAMPDQVRAALYNAVANTQANVPETMPTGRII